MIGFISVLLVVADGLLHRGNLVTQIDHTGKTLVLIVGFALGGALSLWVSLNRSKSLSAREALGLFGMPFLVMLLFSHVARRVVEIVNFTATNAILVRMDAAVISKSRSRKMGITHAEILPYIGARTLTANVNEEVFERLMPGRDCIMLNVETGRRGVRRTELPNILDEPLGIGSVVPCK
jgi:hypothetical protein